MLLFHAYWGALFIRLFGFSFACLRFSTMPFALGAVGLCYLLVRQAVLWGSGANLRTLFFVIFSIFFSLSVSFYYDLPGLFFFFFFFFFFSFTPTLSTFPH